MKEKREFSLSPGTDSTGVRGVDEADTRRDDLAVPHGASRRRVAYLVNQYPAISHTFIRREIEALEALGWDVRRFTIRRANDLVDPRDWEENGRTSALLPINILDFATTSVILFTKPLKALKGLAIASHMSFRSERGFFRSMFAVAEAMILLRRFARLEISHAHAHFATNPTTVLRIARALGGPTFSFTVHGPFEIDAPYSWSIKEKACEAAFVVAVSKFARAQLMRVTPSSMWDKIHVIRCGLPCRSPETQPSDVPASTQLLCIGRLSEEKGHLILLRAVARLVAQQVPVTLLLVGDGPLRSQLEDEIARLELKTVVRLLGSVCGQTIATLLDASRALVLPSFAEGLPVVLTEAFRAGRPAIATNVGAVSELVRSNVSGWLVPPGDEDELVAAMRDALTRPVDDLTQMGRAAFKLVTHLHDAHLEALKLSGLLETVVAPGVSHRPPAHDASAPHGTHQP